jgi:hypothetical protein
MQSPLRSPGRFVLAAAIAGWALRGAPLFAGDDDDLTEREPPAVAHTNLGFINPNPPQNADALQPGKGRDDPARQRLHWLLRRKVLDVAHSARLTETQKQKLLLAGQGDIVRLDDRVDEVRAKYSSAPGTEKTQQEIDRENRRTKFLVRGGVFARDSLFEKTLKKTLTAEQFARYEKTDQKRRVFQHRAGVHMTVLRLSTAIGLNDDQWKQLEQVLLKETRPAQIIGHPYPAAYFNIVYVQMRQIPEAKLKPLFEPWQWRTLQRKLVDAEHFGGGFENNGIFLAPDDDPEQQIHQVLNKQGHLKP